MKSELTTIEPKATTFSKLMKNRDCSIIILANSQTGNSIHGTCVWTIKEFSHYLGKIQTDWGADLFTDLPRTECVILSNS